MTTRQSDRGQGGSGGGGGLRRIRGFAQWRPYLQSWERKERKGSLRSPNGLAESVGVQWVAATPKVPDPPVLSGAFAPGEGH